MPTAYILILLAIYRIINPDSAIALTSQVFATSADCNLAGSAAEREFSKLGVTIRWVCVPQGVNLSLDK